MIDLGEEVAYKHLDICLTENYLLTKGDGILLKNCLVSVISVSKGVGKVRVSKVENVA